MLKRIWDTVLMIWEEIYDFLGINFMEIHYPDINFSIVAGLTLLSLFLVKILWRRLKRDKNAQKHSGHEISRYYLRGLIAMFLSAISKGVFALAVAGVLLALAEPFLDQIREDQKVIESRVRVDVRDVSSSMKLFFPNVSKSKAQVAAEAHLEFLKMREGKNDRVSFWIFASYPHLIEDFISDDALYYQQVEDAPWLAQSMNMESSFGSQVVPAERYGAISGEGGGTDIVLILQAVIKQFDEDEKKLAKAGINIRRIKRSVLVLTDAEVYAIPDNELNGLQQRNIKPYVIWIKSSLVISTPDFISRVRAYGGEYFDVTDENSLARAYESIDKLETAKVVITRKSFQLPLFQNFIFMAIVIMFVAVFVALLIEPFGVYPE